MYIASRCLQYIALSGTSRQPSKLASMEFPEIVLPLTLPRILDLAVPSYFILDFNLLAALKHGKEFLSDAEHMQHP